MCVTIAAIFSFRLLLVGKGESRKHSVSNSAVKQPSLVTGRWSPFGVRPGRDQPVHQAALEEQMGQRKWQKLRAKVIDPVTFCARDVTTETFFTDCGHQAKRLAASSGGDFL